MNRAIKERWIAALRGGDYRQGHGVLRSSGNEYCCLGVLCELAVQEGVIPEPQPWSHDPERYVYGEDTVLPPAEVTDWAELGSANPGVDGEYLTTYNDGEDDLPAESFSQIADRIEHSL